MHLDPRTLGVASNLVAVSMTAVASLLWLSGKMYPGFGRWTLARLIGILTLLFSVQIGVWPHSILFADVFGTLSVILTLEACREFIGLRPVIWAAYAAAAALLFQLSLAGSDRLDYAEASLAWGAVSACIAFTLLRNRLARAERARFATACAFLVHCAFYTARTAYFMACPGATLMDKTSLNLLFLAENIVFGLAANVSFILMHYERVLTEKAEETARTREANAALTELKTSLEERVRQGSAELLEARKLDSLGRLAGGVAHDFNNILTIINGQSGRLLRQLPLRDPIREPLAQIAKAGEHAASLTRQLLTFSRQGKQEEQIVALNPLLRDLTGLLRSVIPESIEIVFRPGPGEFNVRADRGNLEQVVMNLAFNARDAMPDGGKLFIETSSTAIEDDFAALCLSAPAGRYVSLTVTDTGAGMAPEVQARAFEPFFTTKGLDKGTGLGLSTVYGIVKQSGGAITVHSAPGIGTTLRLMFPAVDVAPHTEAVTAPAPVPIRGTETVLVVEDRKEVRELLCDLLEDHGYRTLAADGGNRAIAVAKRHSGKIDLLVTDMVLPGMNGPEIERAIRALMPGIRVLRVSGYAEQLSREIDDLTPFLQKPFTEEALIGKVRSILDGTLPGEPVPVEV
jgi:signal transduction histidine kinase/CheY-like chemotaxis protein